MAASRMTSAWAGEPPSDLFAPGSAVRATPLDRVVAEPLRLEVLLGVLLALYLLVGRWSPLRLIGEDEPLAQVRFWILLGLALLLPVVIFRAPRIETEALRRVLVPAGCFIGYMMLTIVWTPYWESALAKVLDLALMLLVALVAVPLLRRCDPERFALAFWMTIVVLAGLNALLVTASGVWTLASGDRVTPLGGGPNVFARMMGLLCMAAVYLSMKTRLAMLWLGVAAYAVLLVLASGSRGGLLALPLAFAALWAKRRTGRLRALAAGVLLVGAVSGLATYTEIGADAIQTFDRRVRQLTFEQRYDSGRTAIYEEALQMGLDNPLVGAGLDAFQITGAHGLYQHNLLLEAFSEGGIIALALLLWLMALVLRDVIVVRTVEGLVYGATFVMIVAGAQVSGDIFDSRGLFLLPLLLAAAPAIPPSLTEARRT